MSSIFEFSISRLGYEAIFMKISEKKIWPILKIFFTNQDKNEDENEKIWKNEIDFEFSISKLGYMKLFRKIWEKFFFSKF